MEGTWFSTASCSSACCGAEEADHIHTAFVCLPLCLCELNLAMTGLRATLGQNNGNLIKSSQCHLQVLTSHNSLPGAFSTVFVYHEDGIWPHKSKTNHEDGYIHGPYFFAGNPTKKLLGSPIENPSSDGLSQAAMSCSQHVNWISVALIAMLGSEDMPTATAIDTLH